MNNFENFVRTYDTIKRESEIKLSFCRMGTMQNDLEEMLDDLPMKDIVLKKHQRQMINEMLKLENSKIELSDNEYMNTEMGVISNKVGSGKSFCILGLILKLKKLETQEFVKHKYG